MAVTRLLLHTNVVVGALLWSGPPAQLMNQAVADELGLVSSPVLLAELRTTLGYAKFDTVFREPGIEPPPGAVEVDVNSQWSLSMVACTDMLSLVPRSAGKTPGSLGVRPLEFEPLWLARTIGLFSRAQTHRSPLLSEFVEALKDRRAARKDRR